MNYQNHSHQIVVIGGGTAGLTVANQLSLQSPGLDIAIIEPSSEHNYQPGWTLIGGGILKTAQTVRPEKSFIPPGASWIQDRVVNLDPDHHCLTTAQGKKIPYEILIVCPGIQIDWHLIEGLPETLGRNGVTSNYAKHCASYTWELIQNFRGGTALFTYPATPLKCGGAPQKIMYMADDIFQQKSGVGTQTQVMFCTADTKLFTVPEYAQVLEQVIKRRNITVNYQYNLKAVRGDRREAIFERRTEQGQEEVCLQYDLLHIGPPMSAPDFIKQSPLSDATPGGWVEVHPDTLQHLRYSNVFALGDASSLPTSKTAAAVRGQAPVVVANILSLLQSQPLTAKYDGYTCCPVITGYNAVMMAEFNYRKKPISSFFLEPTKERYLMWLVKVYLLPWLYWHRMLTGQPFEKQVLANWKAQIFKQKSVNPAKLKAEMSP
ncbi:MAG: FAD-dependent oxidoreductase [Microcystaceae cyanobacterium]